MWQNFDQYASLYDAWFLNNPNVLLSELRLVAHTLDGSVNTLSVGCGSGLFEKLLADNYGIHVQDGIEPAEGMAAIARKRGMNVTVGTAETATFGTQGQYDTIMFNGSPGYIDDLDAAMMKAYDALPRGGRVILIDVPKESSYGLLYNLAKTLGTWDHPLLAGTFPADPYPIELVAAANWRTTDEKVESLKRAGFTRFDFAQTLTTHPIDSDRVAEEPTEGHDKGDYVAITAHKD